MKIREFLQNEYAFKKGKNRFYSIRQFALTIGCDPSSLRKILKGQRIPSAETLTSWKAKFNWTDEQLQFFLNEASVAGTEKKQQTIKKQKELCTFSKEILTDHYQWYFPILLETAAFENFTDKIESIAQKLNLAPAVILETFAHFKEVGLLIETEPGNYRPVSTTTIGGTISTEHLREIQKHYLKMAIACIDSVSPQQRENVTLTVSLSEKDLKKVSEVLKKSRQRINSLSLKNQKSATTVYNISMATYPVFKDE